MIYLNSTEILRDPSFSNQLGTISTIEFSKEKKHIHVSEDLRFSRLTSHARDAAVLKLFATFKEFCTSVMETITNQGLQIQTL